MRGRLFVAGLIAGAVVVLDQWTKWIIQDRYRLGEGSPFIDGILGFSHVRNSGVAFGLFANLEAYVRVPLFLSICVIAVWVLLKILASSGRLVSVRVAVGLIGGGALGNQIDRLRYLEVVDFIDVWIGAYHWPTFNVADSAISVGTGLLLFALWRVREL